MSGIFNTRKCGQKITTVKRTEPGVLEQVGKWWAWLHETTAEDRAARTALDATRRTERAAVGADAMAVRAEFTGVEAQSLHAAAVAVGYADVTVPSAACEAMDVPVFYERDDGARIAFVPTADGGLTAYTAGDVKLVHEIVRHDVADSIRTHLAPRADVTEQYTVNGDLEFTARERLGIHGERATVRIRVAADGAEEVDVDLAGPRCATIARDLAAASGSAVVAERKKQQYFQLPGEPMRVRVGG